MEDKRHNKQNSDSRRNMNHAAASDQAAINKPPTACSPQEAHSSDKKKAVTYTTFPEKLMSVLDDGNYGDCISWSTSGQSFGILLNKFDRVLDTHFQGTKTQSFLRKLSRWGFKRSIDEGCLPDAHVFTHEMFKRGRHDLVAELKSFNKKPKQKQTPTTTTNSTDALQQQQQQPQQQQQQPQQQLQQLQPQQHPNKQDRNSQSPSTTAAQDHHRPSDTNNVEFETVRRQRLQVAVNMAQRGEIIRTRVALQEELEQLHHNFALKKLELLNKANALRAQREREDEALKAAQLDLEMKHQQRERTLRQALVSVPQLQDTTTTTASSSLRLHPQGQNCILTQDQILRSAAHTSRGPPPPQQQRPLMTTTDSTGIMLPPSMVESQNTILSQHNNRLQAERILQHRRLLGGAAAGADSSSSLLLAMEQRQQQQQQQQQSELGAGSDVSARIRHTNARRRMLPDAHLAAAAASKRPRTNSTTSYLRAAPMLNTAPPPPPLTTTTSDTLLGASSSSTSSISSPTNQQQRQLADLALQRHILGLRPDYL